MRTKFDTHWWWPWVLLPCTATVVIVLIIVTVDIPLVTTGVKLGTLHYRHYVRKRNAKSLPALKNTVQNELILIDSLIHRIERTPDASEGRLVDEIYHYAEASDFTAKKVETGNQHTSTAYTETPLTVKGTGTYQSVGKLVEHIENNHQITRIRHLSMSMAKNGMLDVVIDVLVQENMAGVGK